LLLGGVLLLVFPFVRSLPAVLAVTLVWAIVSELFRPANLVIIADIVTPDKLKPAYALSRLSINVGMSVGPAAAGFIAERSFTWIFIGDAVTTLIAAAVLIWIPIGVAHRHAPEDASAKEGSVLDMLVLDDTRMVLFLAAVFLMGAVFFQIEGPLPLFLVQDLSLSPAFYGGLFTLNTVMIVFMEVPLNAATAHWPHRRALAIGAFLFAVGSGAFGFAAGPIPVVLAMIVWTFGEMIPRQPRSLPRLHRHPGEASTWGRTPSRSVLRSRWRRGRGRRVMRALEHGCCGLVSSSWVLSRR
jgi:predicted MFS family arabinose efflux permease